MPISVSSSKLMHCYLRGTSGCPQMNNSCLTVVRTREKCVSFSVVFWVYIQWNAENYLEFCRKDISQFTFWAFSPWKWNQINRNFTDLGTFSMNITKDNVFMWWYLWLHDSDQEVFLLLVRLSLHLTGKAKITE